MSECRWLDGSVCHAACALECLKTLWLEYFERAPELLNNRYSLPGRITLRREARSWSGRGFTALSFFRLVAYETAADLRDDTVGPRSARGSFSVTKDDAFRCSPIKHISRGREST